MPTKNIKSLEAEMAALAFAILVLSYLAIFSMGMYGKVGHPMPAPIVNNLAAAADVKPLPFAVVTPAYASPGKLIDGFPAGMIIDATAKISDSYSLNYNASLNQYTTIFNSGMAMGDLFSNYLSYFQKNGWTITNEVTQYPTSRGIYATKGNNEASVAIVTQAWGPQATVSYLVK